MKLGVPLPEGVTKGVAACVASCDAPVVFAAEPSMIVVLPATSGTNASFHSGVAGTLGGDEASALFGSFSIGIAGYVAIVVLVVLMAVVTAFASRRTVNQTLEAID